MDKPIGIGIVGIGSIGRGMVLQSTITPGISCLAIADIILERATAWAEELELPYRVATSLDDMHDIIRSGLLAVTDDGSLLAQCEDLDVFVEATNATLVGAQNGILALEHDKHVVMMNYEADLMYGAYLLQLAEARGLVYTVSDGDQPAVLKRLIDELEMMSFQLVMAGNVKGFMDLYSNPTSIIPEADKRNLDHKMCVSYTDGSKLGVELAVLANGLNMRAVKPGMTGPRMSDIHQIFDHFDFARIWDGSHALVDYVLGCTPKGGVYAIGYTDIPHQKNTLAWFPPDMGPGPFYLFYRPYHLGHFESMATIAEAALHNRPILAPKYGFKTNVFAYAKKPLRRGDTLDGLGGYACYGMIDNSKENEIDPRLPICLAEDIQVVRDIEKDQPLLLSDTNYDEAAPQFDLYFRAVRAGAGTLVAAIPSTQTLA